MVGYLTRPASYKTMLGRVCLGAMLIGQQLTKLTHCSMSYILLLSRPVVSMPLSFETLVWLLLVVAYSDSLTMSQAEVPLEQIHTFYWEMVHSIVMKLQVEMKKEIIVTMQKQTSAM